METEYIYLNHDNRIGLILKSNNSAVDLSGVRRISLSFGTVALDSTVSTSSTSISWSGATYATGEVQINLGKSTVIKDKIGAGHYQTYLNVADDSNMAGIIWGKIPIIIESEVEGTT